MDPMDPCHSQDISHGKPVFFFSNWGRNSAVEVPVAYPYCTYLKVFVQWLGLYGFRPLRSDIDSSQCSWDHDMSCSLNGKSSPTSSSQDNFIIPKQCFELLYSVYHWIRELSWICLILQPSGWIKYIYVLSAVCKCITVTKDSFCCLPGELSGHYLC